MNVPVFQTLGDSWIVVPSLPSWCDFRSMAPALTLFSVCSSLHLFTCAHCARCYPSIHLCFGLANPCTCKRLDRITRSCAWHICVTWSAKSLSFVPSCTSSFLYFVWKSLSTTYLRLPIQKLICSNTYVKTAAPSAPKVLLPCSFASASLSPVGTLVPVCWTFKF